MGDFLVGIDEKYPKPLLLGRREAEGNVISCFMKDMLLLDETTLTRKDFVTTDGVFYYSMLNTLRKKGFYNLDEVTIVSSLGEEAIEQYEERGGWETIQHLIDIINTDNFDTYLDILYRENIILRMHDDGFNLLKEIQLDKKKIAPLKLMRKMTAEECIDWYESRLTTYGSGYSSKVLEEETIDFSDDFISECMEAVDIGTPFDTAGYDVEGNEINCFSFISRQINGLLHGTFSMIGGASSSGKSTAFITIIMALLYRGEKVLIISNEEDVKKFKLKFIVWLLGKYERYYKVSKKRLMNGDFTEEDLKHINNVRKYWKENYKDKVKFIAIADADMSIVKKKIRENVLRYGFSTVLYDTFKMQVDNMQGERTDLSLVRDSRELHKLAMKYNLIMLASVQLSESSRGQLFLSSANTSNSRQLKEVLENYLLIRNVYAEELDPKSKYFCHPYKLKKVNDKWIEEPYECDPTSVWRMLFIEKARNGTNSPDTGNAYLMKFLGDFAIFKETCQCRPKHGEIR